MINTIIQNIKNVIMTDDYKSVYSSFDNIPYYNKNKEIATYIGMKEFQTRKTVYSLNTIFIPFSAIAEISVTAPLDSSAENLLEFFDKNIMEKLNNSIYHNPEIKKLAIKPDTNIKKLVLQCEFNISGIFRKEKLTL